MQDYDCIKDQACQKPCKMSAIASAPDDPRDGPRIPAARCPASSKGEAENAITSPVSRKVPWIKVSNAIVSESSRSNCVVSCDLGSLSSGSLIQY